MLEGLNLLIRHVLVMVATGTTSASLSSLDLKRGIRVQGTLTLRGLQHLEEVDPSPRLSIKVMCSIPESTVPSVVVLIVDIADMALMPASDAVRTGT